MLNNTLKSAMKIEEKEIEVTGVTSLEMYTEFQMSLKSLFILAICVVNIMNLNFFIQRTNYLGIKSLTKLWSIVDLVIISFNMVIVLTNFVDIVLTTKHVRPNTISV